MCVAFLFFLCVAFLNTDAGRVLQVLALGSTSHYKYHPGFMMVVILYRAASFSESDGEEDDRMRGQLHKANAATCAHNTPHATRTITAPQPNVPPTAHCSPPTTYLVPSTIHHPPHTTHHNVTHQRTRTGGRASLVAEAARRAD